MWKGITALLLCIVLSACVSSRKINFSVQKSSSISGSKFFSKAAAFNWRQRDSFAVREIMSGNVPHFLEKFVAVKTAIFDSVANKRIEATYYVSPDYLSIGTDEDWARVPLTPMAAQQIADSSGCFLPTRKMVNDIYKMADVKLEPIPMFAFRDSTPTMYQHHLMIEGQRKGRRGLIAGIKKDVVISGKITRDTRPNRVAIYGWHKLDGKAIQPLYTGHVDWYVDYSHGIRLVYRKIKLNDNWMDYTAVLNHPVYRRLLCDEEWCNFFKYPY